MRYDPTGGVGPVQPGLPGVLPEEVPLPSEVVLSGGLLDERRRQALAGLRETLIDRPADVDPDEWRVVVATLAPPTAHLPRAPGTPAKALGVLQAARECFPGLAPTTAVKRFREVQQRPHVRAILADIRALELVDVQEQRGMIREALHAVIRRGAEALHRIDPTDAPNEWSKVSACVVAATKVLADMDALALRAEEVASVVGAGQDAEEDAGVPAALLGRVSAVAEDMRRRKAALV